jgi:hypothetical protein
MDYPALLHWLDMLARSVARPGYALSGQASEKNRHDPMRQYRLNGLQDLDVWRYRCERCGASEILLPKEAEHWGGCVALPAPAVLMTPRDLPVVCERSETR